MLEQNVAKIALALALERVFKLKTLNYKWRRKILTLAGGLKSPSYQFLSELQGTPATALPLLLQQQEQRQEQEKGQNRPAPSSVALTEGLLSFVLPAELEQAECYHEKAYQICAAGEEAWPKLFNSISNPPLWFWYKGQAPASLELCAPVAVVGSRTASCFGRYCCQAIVELLAARGHLIVSGLARGIDGYAHEIALRCAAPTAAVLPSGLDNIYPHMHQELAQQICQTGFIMSEYAPAVQALPRAFPSRNRLISALSVAVVVVEAAVKSGTMITASWASEQGRDVYAVPVTPFMSGQQGCNQLLRDGAEMLDCFERLEQIVQPHSEAAQAWLDGAASPYANLLPAALCSQQVEKYDPRAKILQFVHACQPSLTELKYVLQHEFKRDWHYLLELESEGLLEREYENYFLTELGLSCIYGN